MLQQRVLMMAALVDKTFPVVVAFAVIMDDLETTSTPSNGPP